MESVTVVATPSELTVVMVLTMVWMCVVGFSSSLGSGAGVVDVEAEETELPGLGGSVVVVPGRFPDEVESGSGVKVVVVMTDGGVVEVVVTGSGFGGSSDVDGGGVLSLESGVVLAGAGSSSPSSCLSRRAFP